jgi:hypothetical protein
MATADVVPEGPAAGAEPVDEECGCEPGSKP